jgi:type IV pilus assembly protein PilC
MDGYLDDHGALSPDAANPFAPVYDPVPDVMEPASNPYAVLAELDNPYDHLDAPVTTVDGYHVDTHLEGLPHPPLLAAPTVDTPPVDTPTATVATAPPVAPADSVATIADDPTADAGYVVAPTQFIAPADIPHPRRSQRPATDRIPASEVIAQMRVSLDDVPQDVAPVVRPRHAARTAAPAPTPSRFAKLASWFKPTSKAPKPAKASGQPDVQVAAVVAQSDQTVDALVAEVTRKPTPTVTRRSDAPVNRRQARRQARAQARADRVQARINQADAKVRAKANRQAERRAAKARTAQERDQARQARASRTKADKDADRAQVTADRAAARRQVKATRRTARTAKKEDRAAKRAETRAVKQAAKAAPRRLKTPDRSKKGRVAREVRPKMNRRRREELLHFSRQLAAFFDAGVPVVSALNTLADEARRDTFAAALRDIGRRVSDGSTFADALACHPTVFPPFFLGVVAAAELTGDLSAALEHVAIYLERDSETRSKISAALMYPSIVLALALVVVVILVVVVLPKFAQFFNSMNAPMPTMTRVMMSGASAVAAYWWVVLALAWLTVAALVVITRSTTGRARLQSVVMRLPLIGAVIRSALAERFCRLFGSLLSAGIPVVTALEATSEGMDHAVWRTALGKARNSLLNGVSLHESLAATGVLPPVAAQMIMTGEETGSLSVQLGRAASYYARELDTKVKRFTTLLEPLVIIGVGLIVGVIALSLVSAMYGLYQTMGAQG